MDLLFTWLLDSASYNELMIGKGDCNELVRKLQNLKTLTKGEIRVLCNLYEFGRSTFTPNAISPYFFDIYCFRSLLWYIKKPAFDRRLDFIFNILNLNFYSQCLPERCGYEEYVQGLAAECEWCRLGCCWLKRKEKIN